MQKTVKEVADEAEQVYKDLLKEQKALSTIIGKLVFDVQCLKAGHKWNEEKKKWEEQIVIPAQFEKGISEL